MSIRFAVTLAMLGALSGAARAQAITYEVVPLHLTPGRSSLALPINNQGNIAGTLDLPSGRRAFLYDGSVHLLGPDNVESTVADLNNNGRVAATLYPAGEPTHAAMLDVHVSRDYGNLGRDIRPMAINDHPLIVGSAGAGDGADHLFVVDDHQLRDLGTFGELQARGNDINNPGFILAERFPEHPATFLTDAAANLYIPVEPGGETLLNDHNDMAGTNGSGAYFYHDGTGVQLGIPDYSLAFGLNNHGWIVGAAAAEPSRGFVWDGTTWHYLNALLTDPDWFISYGWGINDAGQISAAGCNQVSGECSVLLLNPVPEPAQAALWLAGGAFLLAWRGLWRGRDGVK